MQRDRQQKAEQIKRLVAAIGTVKEPLASITESLAELESAVRCLDQRLAAIRESLESLSCQAINREDVAAAMAQFTPIWEVLHPPERVRVVQLLIERVEYNTHQDAIQIAFRPSGMKGLVQDQAAV